MIVHMRLTWELEVDLGLFRCIGLSTCWACHSGFGFGSSKVTENAEMVNAQFVTIGHLLGDMIGTIREKQVVCRHAKCLLDCMSRLLQKKLHLKEHISEIHIMF
ncbi:hypothetical protein Salat_1122600 [Sesamum alatum]|uniref:Uncharacterized protein n=1 Tax=Sesamum alatum TaxID=300844 RepID=A0AAE1YDF6_9LAMI|nr:hypothetical protein Salat_1122600 [Sesamum alatum]